MEREGQGKYCSVGNQNAPTFYKSRAGEEFASDFLVWENDGIITKAILKRISK